MGHPNTNPIVGQSSSVLRMPQNHINPNMAHMERTKKLEIGLNSIAMAVEQIKASIVNDSISPNQYPHLMKNNEQNDSSVSNPQQRSTPSRPRIPKCRINPKNTGAKKGRLTMREMFERTHLINSNQNIYNSHSLINFNFLGPVVIQFNQIVFI